MRNITDLLNENLLNEGLFSKDPDKEKWNYDKKDCKYKDDKGNVIPQMTIDFGTDKANTFKTTVGKIKGHHSWDYGKFRFTANEARYILASMLKNADEYSDTEIEDKKKVQELKQVGEKFSDMMLKQGDKLDVKVSIENRKKGRLIFTNAAKLLGVGDKDDTFEIICVADKQYTGLAHINGERYRFVRKVDLSKK